MAELRMTLKLPDDLGGRSRKEVLADLAVALQQATGAEDRPRVLREPTEDGDELHPMFLLNVRDPQTAAAALRGLGGWYMRHPDVNVVLRTTGAGGRVALELRRFSTVAFAEAASKVTDAVQASPGGSRPDLPAHLTGGGNRQLPQHPGDGGG